MGANTSPAVMAQRREPHDSLDFFPTPAWGTRALLTYLVDATGRRVWEPACGDGHMTRPLWEVAADVLASDVHDYGWGHAVHDFLMPFMPEGAGPIDLIVTNPPFELAEQFVARALQVAPEVAMLTRTSFVESMGRYRALFRDTRPAVIGQFVERLPMVKGRVAVDAVTATSYCWMVWRRGQHATTTFDWIPPCRARLERPGDYAVAEQAPAAGWWGDGEAAP